MNNPILIFICFIIVCALIGTFFLCDYITDPTKKYKKIQKEKYKAAKHKNHQFTTCPKCGKANDILSKFCTDCGNSFVKQYEATPKRNIIYCPNCGSDNIHFITIQASQNFDKDVACCGYLCFEAPGLLCGVKNKTEARTVRKCMSCNHEF